MRGHPLGGPDKRLRIDFADLDVVPGARRDYEHIDSKHTVNMTQNFYSKKNRGLLSKRIEWKITR